MRDYEMDLFDLDHLIHYGRDFCYSWCDQTYKNTNERLKEIYEQFDFKDKNVFSVLSSSDQVFSAYYLGARIVDTFDYNWPTYYYFYLKKWYLMFYYNYLLETKSEKLVKTLTMYDVKNEEERNVCKVWENLLEKYSDISNMFFKIDLYDWNAPYIKNIERLIEIIKDKRANFGEIDIFKEIQLEKKYDIVILSNILENVHPEDDLNLVISQNLRRILNDDGIVICSILNDRYREMNRVREAFKSHFIYEISNVKGYNKRLKREVPLYYTYKKKS